MNDELLLPKLPPLRVKPNGMFQATNSEYREVVICSVIAWLLKPENAPSVGPVMLNELIRLINRKLNASPEDSLSISDFSEPDIATEVSTEDNKRLDLVIHDSNSRYAILIEAKIYHGIHNPFDSYWSYLPYQDERKRGILLTLGKTKSTDHRFTNITYSEWFSNVNKNLPNELEIRERIFWEDLYENIEYISTTLTMNKSIQYVFDHAKQVEELISRRNQAVGFILQQLSQAADTLEWELYGKSETWRNIWDAKSSSNIYFTLLPIEILKNYSDIGLILEVDGPLVQHTDAVKKFIVEAEGRLDKHKSKSLVISNSGDVNHQHIGKWRVPVNTPSQIGERIAETIKDKMNLINSLKEHLNSELGV